MNVHSSIYLSEHSSKILTMTTWLAEDPELLQAALEIVDTWDESFISTATSPTSSSSTDEPIENGSSGDDSTLVNSPPRRSSSPISKMTPLLSNLAVTSSAVAAMEYPWLQPSTIASTHHRRRREIKALRETEAQLCRELEALERKKRVQIEQHDGNQLDGNQLRRSMWRDIAIRQQHLRTIAESKRQELRVKIAEQRKVVDGLVKLVNRARRQEDDEKFRSVKRQRVGSSDSPTTNDFSFLGTLLMNQGLVQSRHYDDPEKSLSIKRLDDQANQIVVELGTAWVLPFDEQSVMDALWGWSFLRYEKKCCPPNTFVQDLKIHSTADEHIYDFTGYYSEGSLSGNFAGQGIVKRVPKSSTTPPSISGNAMCSPNGSKFGSFTELSTREELSVCVVPGLVGKHRRGSRVQFSQRIIVTFEDTTTGRHQADLMTHLLMDRLHYCVDMMKDSVEMLLLTPQAH